MHLVPLRPCNGKSLLLLSGWSIEGSDTGWVWIGMRKYLRKKKKEVITGQVVSA